jgi:hypothetical protein
MWTGVVPQSLCYYVGTQALRFEGANEWHTQAYDYGCGGSYRIVSTAPPMVAFDSFTTTVTFTYTLTADRLVLQSTTPYAIYTLVPCPRWDACAGIGP